jgi:RNA polymerase sigma factor (TIGR02999 family)
VNFRPEEVTLLLQRLRRGDEGAADELLRVVYEELRRIARAHMGKEAAGHTPQMTALIHEAWLRLAGQTRVDWRDRTHFYGVAAQMMRRVRVDRARARLAGKRVAGAAPLNLDWIEIESTPRKLEEILVGETATALGLSSRTVDRECALASAWLRAEFSRKGAA